MAVNTATATTPHYVKKRISKIRDSIDEQKFLTSDSFRTFLEKIIRGLSGDYTLKLLFSNMVCADGKRVYVNPLSELLSNVPDLPRKTLAILGQVAHEFFHIMYTDFKVLEMMEIEFKSQSNFRYKQIHESFNIIEDSAVELAGTNYYTGSLKEAIIYNNEISFKGMPSLNELHAKGAPRLVIFKMACAMYCILGRMKGTIADPEIKELFKQAMPILEQGRLQPDSEGRYEYAKKLYALMLPLIEEVEQLHQQVKANTQYVYTKNNQISHGGKNQRAQSAPQIKTDFQAANRQKTQQEMEQDEQQGAQMQSGMPQCGGQDDESEENNSSGANSQENAGSKQKPKGQDQQSSAGKGSGEDEEIEEGSSKSGSGQAQSDNETEEQTGEKGNGEESENTGNTGKSTGTSDDEDASGEGNQTGSEENGNKADEEANAGEESGKEGESSDDAQADEESAISEEMAKAIKNLEEQLEGVKDDVAWEEYNKEEQKNRDKEIMEFAKTVKYADLHNGVVVKPVRKFSVFPQDMERYQLLFEKIKGLHRSLARQLTDLIKFNEDRKMSGLYSGKVNRTQLHRLDKKVFYQRKEKSDEADLAVLVLVDESGSMAECDRILYAKLACIMLYETCKKLNIPFAVIGHYAEFCQPNIIHNHYVDFDSTDPNEKYKLMLLRYMENTREGVSLKYAGEYLLQRPEQDKILIAISDGDPYHNWGPVPYCDKVSQSDTGRVVKDLEAKGLKIYGVAIGDGKSKIKEIYTHNYIDIPDIKHLPGKLVELIRKNLFK